jgi:uncharacterized protein
VKLLDANVLLYSADRRSIHHGSAKAWLDRATSTAEPLLIPWLSVVAFLRISTLPSVFPHPLTVPDAMSFLRPLMTHKSVLIPEPDARHLDRVADLLAPLDRGGNLINDAHLAALAQQYGASVVSYDYDFGLFDGVTWERPPPVPEG